MDKKLKALQKQWYKKLAQTGFKDIEDDRGNLKEYSFRLQSSDITTVETSQEYYEAARALNHTQYVQGARDRTIWRLYSEGTSVEKIAERVGMGKRHVWDIIYEIERRYILPKQKP